MNFSGPQARNCNLPPYLLYNVTDGAESVSGSSLCNKVEAALVAKLVARVRDLKRKANVSVITFYAKQRALVQDHLAKAGMPNVPVKTVDGFQGSESDFVVISCVRTDLHSIGFLSETERLNVALTRARYGCYVVGSFSRLTSNDMWRSLADDAGNRKCMRVVSSRAGKEMMLP